MTPAILQLIIALAPEIPSLVKDIASLFKAHPAFTPEMLLTLVNEIHVANADTLALIAADKQAHP